MTEQIPTTTKAVATTKASRLTEILHTDSVSEQFEAILKDNKAAFEASLVDLFLCDSRLQMCSPAAIITEALKAATLKLPINKNLGFASIVPYKGQPQFQIGYKGYIQLALRTNAYRCVNADSVYEGELENYDKLTGEFSLGKPKSDIVVGYFAMFEMLSGFKKMEYWPADRVLAHAKKYASGFHNKRMPWQTDFYAMACKTLLKSILSKYGSLSIEFTSALDYDTPPASFNENVDDDVESDVTIDITLPDEEAVPDVPEPAAPKKATQKKAAPKKTASKKKTAPKKSPGTNKHLPTEEQFDEIIRMADADEDAFKSACDQMKFDIATNKDAKISDSDFDKLSILFDEIRQSAPSTEEDAEDDDGWLND